MGLCVALSVLKKEEEGVGAGRGGKATPNKRTLSMKSTLRKISLS